MGGQRRGLRVLVIGGGIGGLCLAQGLRQHDVDVTVYERDESALGRRQGYRLRISPEGEQALRDCLPHRAQQLLVATANMRYEKGLAAYDERLNPQWAPTFEDARGDAPDKVDAVDRVTLRRILLAGLDDRVCFGKRFTHYEQRPGGQVAAWFDDGTHDVGDVLVAADGTNSRVRTQLGGEHALSDLGVRAILSRTPMAAAIQAGMPEVLRDRFTYVIGADGFHLGMMPMVFRTEPRKAAAELWPGLEFDDVQDYYMSVFSVHRSELGLADEEFFAMTGRQLCDLVLKRTSGWHPDLHGVFDYAEPEQTFPVALRATLPVLSWKAGNIVPLGDAVHAMPPSGGVGANTAVRDASALSRALVAVDQGKQSLAEAVAAYQEAMTGYATEAVVMSLKIAQWSMKLDFAP
ncbi:2-polyprenyl-6-methoxyphenol hydroxylase-like FAD-dependent oxidoreductase [Kibdelosporangium banguiense]|uniref:2-polyprenyl-6-methoxyphenol hydroxylase-like FAD-dependent oxidoreductase n=1 Tax=Kibdelosporangium banguiense TaxID=1365924 RepID=A0ABS4TSB3_9PSEU|nr:FAD-dependent monooxygenase [Kibdelosporangium banguiense]MBP2327292.1 2-polyprenyl-6-methoxyphenol hydroxylase-like FAD-dependent oxidoreductase [Kibdelosporangium banguiense]